MATRQLGRQAMPPTHDPAPAPLPAMLMPSVGTLGVVATIAALRVGRALVLPIVLAILASLILSPLVRWLRRRRVPEHFGAAVVVFGALAVATSAAISLIGPATNFLNRAPAALSMGESRIRTLVRPLEALQETAERIQQVAAPPAGDGPARVSVAAPGILARWSGSTVSIGLALFSTIFLSYFLLASGPMFRRKVADALPSRFERAAFATLFDEIELVTSRYLLLSLIINAGVALATATGLWLVGMPNALMWGCIAGVLNFVPYLGAYTTLALLTLSALSTPETTGHEMFAPVILLCIHLLESNIVTPTVLGRRLPLSSIAVFVALLFWGWMWGIPGAVIGVPLTVVIKVTCDHLPGLEHVGALLND
jgi:predicted PurR-regulated permease PerM